MSLIKKIIKTAKLILLLVIIALAIKGFSSIIRETEYKEAIYIMKIDEAIFSSEKVIKELKSIEDIPNIKSVILRLNSPGGAIGASQEIFKEIEKFKEKTGKKFVCSIENIGASGAYYISLACDKILALPGSIVGSIGVISIFFSAEELIEKFHIKPFIVKSGKFKDSGTPLRNPTEEDIRYINTIVQKLFEQFKRDVKMKRPNLKVSIDEIADGRVFSGEEAVELGLIDGTGTFSDAVSMAIELAGIKIKPKIIWGRKKKPLMELLNIDSSINTLINKIFQPMFM